MLLVSGCPTPILCFSKVTLHPAFIQVSHKKEEPNVPHGDWLDLQSHWKPWYFQGYICCKIKGCAYWQPMPCCIKLFDDIWYNFSLVRGVACFAFVFLANRNIVDSPNYGNSYPTRELFWNINIYIFWICDNYSNRWSSIMHINNSIRALSCVKTF